MGIKIRGTKRSGEGKHGWHKGTQENQERGVDAEFFLPTLFNSGTGTCGIFDENAIILHPTTQIRSKCISKSAVPCSIIPNHDSEPEV
jgi:hypothetical protein